MFQLSKTRLAQLRAGIRVAAVVLVLLAGSAFIACASLHHAHHSGLMKGSVLSAGDGRLVLCIGSRDGAAVGQELKAYEYVRSAAPRGVGFTRRETGVVRITEIVDEHFAHASVVSGTVKENAIVELE